MQHEQPDYGGDNLAEIWQSAQHRRTEDIYSWFAHLPGRRSKSSEPRIRPLLRRGAAFIWKLLEATHAVSRATH
jgi:hypothetical protein